MNQSSIALRCPSCDATFRTNVIPNNTVTRCPRCHQLVSLIANAVQQSLKRVFASHEARATKRGIG
jgi:uncharacterized paraquat-inducible protein A